MAVRKHYVTDFKTIMPGTQSDGTVLSGSDGETNYHMIDGMLWEQLVIETGGDATISNYIPVKVLEGADFKATDANAEGAIWVPGGNFRGSPMMYTIGTDPAFYCQLQVQATDWSGALLQVGFHGTAAATDPIQALTKTWDNFTDKATIGTNAGGTPASPIYTNTAINNATDVDTDTGITTTDGDVFKFRVNVSAAGVVTYQAWIAPTATPTTFTAQTLTTVAYTFDSGDYVVPMIYILTHTDTATLLEFNRFECGYQ